MCAKYNDKRTIRMKMSIKIELQNLGIPWRILKLKTAKR